jgi:hypothetical protein
MVLAEVVIVAALAGVAWHELAGIAPPSAPFVLPAPATPDDTLAPDVPVEALALPTPPSGHLLPGLNVDPAFWRERLAGLNEAQAQFEALEWRIIHSAMETTRRYLDAVVIPVIEQAETRRSG